MSDSQFASQFVRCYWEEVASNPPEFADHSDPCTESAEELLATISSECQKSSTGELTVVMQSTSGDAWRFVFKRRDGDWVLQVATSGTPASPDQVDLLDSTYEPSFGPFLQRILARTCSNRATGHPDAATDSEFEAQSATPRKVIGATKVLFAVMLVCGWLIGLGGWPLITWSPLNCRHEEIDINSGRIRAQRFLAGVCVSEQVTESPVSLEMSDAAVRPDWRRVNTFSPLVGHSPHYSFHSAIHQTRKLQIIWELSDFSPDERRESCHEILKQWQAGRSDASAEEYLATLANSFQMRTQRRDKSATEP